MVDQSTLPCRKGMNLVPDCRIVVGYRFSVDLPLFIVFFQVAISIMSVGSSLYPESTTISSVTSDIVESSESCLSEMSQVSDTIGEELEGVVAEILGEDVPPVCCRLANQIPADGAETVNAILGLASSEYFRKCERF